MLQKTLKSVTLVAAVSAPNLLHAKEVDDCYMKAFSASTIMLQRQMHPFHTIESLREDYQDKPELLDVVQSAFNFPLLEEARDKERLQSVFGSMIEEECREDKKWWKFW